MAEEKIQTETTDEKEFLQQEEDIKDKPVNEKDQVEEENDNKKPHRKIRKDKKEEKIIELENKLDEISDKHLRLQAEFDNFRRRTLKEKAELIKTAGESILVNILPVVDDFDRALDAMKSLDDNDPSKQGILLIYNKLLEFLKQNNVKEIVAINEEFNCDLHEAITKIPAPKEELKGKNVDVVQKGYILSDKVIRFAKVVVGE